MFTSESRLRAGSGSGHGSGRALALGFGISALALGLGCDAGEPGPSEEREVAEVAACDAVAEWDATARQLEERVVSLINSKRRLGGRCGDTTYPPLPALRLQPSLRCAARIHTLDMEAKGYVDYADPEDPEALNTNQRLELAGYGGSTFVETIGAGWTSADDAVAEWMNNEAHCWKFMTEELDHIGIGVYYAGEPQTAEAEGEDDVNYGTYWDLVIATPN